ncbi:DUF397 domain-containing protein [Streptomyces cyaneofuscatus]|uniref:DUF397 domain-containing protein n=1 Tax=Streptomyces TaxID=1883 RepID=UPI0013707434|nr:DUF397 domain-containing protein [Streptomyces sp. SID2119]MYW29352.1 DUF397 domain-containing protein [Streptomyces sp. SID2119]
MVRYGLPDGTWVKSSYSPDNGGNCVEIQQTSDGLVALGDSKDRALGAHTFAPREWQAFVAAVRDGSL